MSVPSLVLLAVVLVACGGDNAAGPVIDEVLPSAAAPGARVEIIGARFCGDDAQAAGDQGTCASVPDAWVSFGAGSEAIAAADVASWGDQRITVTVPDGAAPAATVVVVTVGDTPSNPIDFEVQ